MPKRVTYPLSLRLAPDVRYLSLLHGLIDHGAALHGLEQGRRAALATAAASVFKLMCQTAAPESRCEMVFASRPSCVELVLTCAVDPTHLPCFNCLEPEAAALLLPDIAAAPPGPLFGPLFGIDRMRVEPTETGDMRVTLRQEKEFPFVAAPVCEAAPAQAPLAPPFRMLQDLTADANDNLLYEACLRCQRAYPKHLLLKAMLQPAKFAAMLKGGELAAALVLDAHRRPAGLLCWERTGLSNVIFFGPYIFDVSAAHIEPVATILTEQFLNSIARADIVGVFSGLATPELPAAYFERLGRVRYALDEGLVVDISSWYRHMREDFGGTVWRHPALADFLRDKYAELGFVREFRDLPEHAPRPANGYGNNNGAAGSLFAIDIRRELAEAVVRPLENGADCARNLDRHLASLTASGVRNIFFHVDLAFSWQTSLTPLLLERGFRPVLLLPCAGRSDILVLHYDQDAPV